MRFWCSWIQPKEDHRPLTFPPNEAVLGWWCSGYDEGDNPTLCAAVDAEDETAAHNAIYKDWPEVERWRFFDVVENDWRPSDRFPLSDWMEERFGAA